MQKVRESLLALLVVAGSGAAHLALFVSDRPYDDAWRLTAVGLISLMSGALIGFLHRRWFTFCLLAVWGSAVCGLMQTLVGDAPAVPWIVVSLPALLLGGFAGARRGRRPAGPMRAAGTFGV